MWHKLNEDHTSINTIPALKYGGGSIVLWGYVSSSETGLLVKTKMRMNGAKRWWWGLLKENLLQSAEKL